MATLEEVQQLLNELRTEESQHWHNTIGSDELLNRWGSETVNHYHWRMVRALDDVRQYLMYLKRLSK